MYRYAAFSDSAAKRRSFAEPDDNYKLTMLSISQTVRMPSPRTVTQRNRRFGNLTIRHRVAIDLGIENLTMFISRYKAGGTSSCGPRSPTWASQQVGWYLMYTGRGVSIREEAAPDHLRH